MQSALDAADLAKLAEDCLLHQILISGRIADAELERVLTAARRDLLSGVSGAIDEPMLAFFSALARQCFINEYVFADSEQERSQVDLLRDATVERLDRGDDIPPPWLAALAAYAPLHSLAHAERLLDRTWPQPIDRILTQQIREVLEERAIRDELPSLTAIDPDSVSVQAQYEENPYPRWITPPPALRALTVNDYLRAKFPLVSFRPVETPGGADVLIAGCGSGSHAIEACRRFANARVLAVDLSRTSLAYAARKTRQLALPIEYAQADILKLASLARTFDVIEANGSLQCLKDPAKGWRVLLGLLRSGGVMSVGLYSQIARADINAARAFIAERGCDGSPQEIRRCRQEIFAFPDGAPGRSVIRAGDFYSTSDCRDLLFHVQEYQHTLPEIAAFVAAENLRFLGFQLDARVLRAYAVANPDDTAMTDLARWDAFERANPHVFASMYQFVVQKP